MGKTGFYLLQRITEGLISIGEGIIESVSDSLANAIIKRLDKESIEEK